MYKTASSTTTPTVTLIASHPAGATIRSSNPFGAETKSSTGISRAAFASPDPIGRHRHGRDEISIEPDAVGNPMQTVREGSRWMLRLDDGQDLFETLSTFAVRENVRAATVVFGIGMFRQATFGYWDGSQYQPHEITVPHEVVSLHGTIARQDRVPSLHLHAAAAGPDHRIIGGHLLRATVGMLQEILVESFPGRTFGRPMVESFGLKMLDLEPPTDP